MSYMWPSTTAFLLALDEYNHDMYKWMQLSLYWSVVTQRKESSCLSKIWVSGSSLISEKKRKKLRFDFQQVQKVKDIVMIYIYSFVDLDISSKRREWIFNSNLCEQTISVLIEQQLKDSVITSSMDGKFLLRVLHQNQTSIKWFLNTQ